MPPVRRRKASSRTSLPRTRSSELNEAEPKLDWTYDDFLEAAKALTKDGKYGFGAWPYPDSWLPFALSEGATYLTADGKLDLTNDSLVAAFTKYTALVHEQQVAPQIPSTKDTNYM